MKNFARWFSEARKKGSKESIPPTAVSSPLRGQNQDQSGYNGKNNVADYTISDETVPDNWEENTPAKRIKTVKKLMKPSEVHGAKEFKEEVINELSPELVGKVNKARLEKPSKTVAASKTLSRAVNKAFLKSKVGTIKEVIAGVGDVRIKPVNMAQTTGGVDGDSTTKNANQLQNAANKRVAALDKAAQKQKDEQEKAREKIQKQREMDAAARDKLQQKQSTI